MTDTVTVPTEQFQAMVDANYSLAQEVEHLRELPTCAGCEGLEEWQGCPSHAGGKREVVAGEPYATLAKTELAKRNYRAEVERLRRALRDIPGLVAKHPGKEDGHTGGAVTNWIASDLDDVVEAILAGEPMPEDWV